MAKIKEYEVHVEQMKIEAKRVEGEEKRKYLEHDAQVAKQKSEYQVILWSSTGWFNRSDPLVWLLHFMPHSD